MTEYDFQDEEQPGFWDHFWGFVTGIFAAFFLAVMISFLLIGIFLFEFIPGVIRGWCKEP